MNQARLFAQILLLMLAPLLAISQSDSTFWYNRSGQQQRVFYQSDVFAFRLVGGSIADDALLSPVVRKITTRSEDPDHLTIVEFAPGFREEDYEEVRNLIRSHPAYECSFDVVNLRPSEPSALGNWSPVDDILMVTFRDPQIDAAEIAAFEQRHFVRLHQAPYPGLPSGFSHCHLFKVPQPYLCEDGNRTIDVCRRIWETDSVTAMIVEPNLVMAVKGTTSDPRFSQQWHIQNLGQTLAYNHPGGTPDADHDINWVWNEGYKGANIRVAVLDFDAYDLGHEDMVGAYIDPWNAITGAPLLVGNHLNKFTAHGMCVSGIIGARANNGHGIAGIAPECTIVPILLNSSTAVLAMGVQHAMINYSDESTMVHVMNLSLGYEFPIGNVENELHIAKKAGRNGRGMVIVAGAGNNDIDSPLYPAAYPETISVIGSTPEDKRKEEADGWDIWASSLWGSNYGGTCDVAAGCCYIPTTDLSGQYGYGQNPDSIGNYYIFNGTSAATPIVSGMCALMLQANPMLVDTMDGSWDVRDAIRAGAEKTHPLIYDYNAYPLEPGRSFEMGYGRMNAYNSLLLVGQKEQERAESMSMAIHGKRESGEITAFFQHALPEKGTHLVIRDVLGNEVQRTILTTGNRKEVLTTQGISSGLYIATLEKNGIRISSSIRFAYF
jgi:hypothetical protein